MANVTIQVQSLLNAATYDSYTVADTTTIGTLKTSIQTATGVAAAWYVLYYGGAVLNNANTLASYGITTGSQLRSANKIGHLNTREDRQRAKLDLAALDRVSSSNPRATVDITTLPTQFDGNTIINNPNAGGLVEGRPWITAPAPDPIVTDGLIVNLDAGNTDSYPGSGTTWTNLVDDTAYTITNGSYDSGSGGSIVFDGTSTYVAIGAPLSNGSNFTKEAWVWADVVTSSRNILSSESNVLWNNISTLSAGVGASYSLVTSGSFPTGVWRHVAQTFDDTTNTMRLYINGVQVSQNLSVTQSYISEIERIGAHSVAGSPVSFWDGKIAQVRVYNTALSGTDVLQNYDAEKSRYGL